MENPGRKIEIFVIVSVVALIGIVYAFKQQPVLAPATDNPPSGQTSVKPDSQDQSGQQVQVPSNIIEYGGMDGKNALELLQAGHRVELKEYSFGDFITSIDGIAPDTKHFWALYVNGQFAQVAADKTITRSSDLIKWQIDAVVDTTQ